MAERQQGRLQRVLQVFLERPVQRLGGFEVWRLAELRVDTIYPELMQLEQSGWLLSDRADDPHGQGATGREHRGRDLCPGIPAMVADRRR
jgi:hypothetical protein